MPTPDVAPSPILPADQSTQQISSSQAPEAASSKLEIILPPTQQPSPDAQPETAITAANPLLSSVEWDPQTNTLLLPSGLEVAQILSAGPQTSIVLEDGTILRLSGLEEDVEPLIKIDDQILSAQEIQQAFAALRNVEPGAGPEIAASTPAVFTTPETSNTEPAPSFTEPEPAQGSGNNFEPISIAVQPAFPITPLLLPSEATTAQNTPQTGAGAAQDLPRGSNTTALAISPPDTETPPTLSISSVSSNLFEAGLSNGSASGQAQAQASGSWTIVQSDSPIASLSVYIPSQGQWVDVTNGGQITTDFGVLTVTKTPDGTYKWTYELSNSLDHGVDILKDILNVKVIDESGKEATAPFSMQIVDDTPTIDIADAPNQIGEGETLTGSWSLTEGADGVNTLEISVSGQSKSLDLSGNASAEFILAEGILTINPDGTYSFEASKDLDHSQPQSITFTLTATDGDGDTTTDTHSISIGDGNDPTGPDLLPGQDAHLTMTVEEAALDNSGSDPSSTAETEVSSSLIFTAGSDDLDSFTFADPSSITVSQAATNLSLTWTQNGNQLLGSINGQLAIILQLDASTITAGQQGSVTVTATLTDAFPHTDAQISINGLKVITTDTDGDQASADIRVIITDDTPTITISDSQTAVEEGETLSGSWSLTPGADGVSEVTISVPGQNSQTIQLSENTSAEFILPQGKLIVNPNGTYSFEAAEDLDQSQSQSITFTLTATDGDGDITTDTHSISIADGNDPTGPDLLPDQDAHLTMTVEEAALDDSGSDPSSTAETVVSSSLIFTAGSDDLDSFTFADPSSITVSQAATGLSLTWSQNGNQLLGSINGQLAIILQLDASTITAGQQGSVTVTATLTDAFPHTDAQISINGLKVIATDTDGDQASADIRVIITDDTPTITISDSQTTVEEGETLSGSWSLTPGADGVSEITISVPGQDSQTIQLSENTSAEFVLAQGKLTINPDGTYSFEASKDLDHSQSQSITFTLTATDGDGDTTTDTHSISISDGNDPTGPDLLPGQDAHLTMTVEEAALDNSGSDPSSTAETEVSSSLIFTAGSDDLDSFTFADPSSITVSQAATNLSLTWSQNGNQLLGSINGQLAIILQLDASTITAGQQGSVTVTATLTDAFPHTDAQISINGLKVIATDTDGDQASADIRVIITDDTPTITISDSQTAVEEGETLSSSWSLTPGADGVSEVTISVPGQDSQTIQLSENTSAEFVLQQGKLIVNPNGTCSFEAAENLDHSQDQNITFSLTATDGDGDTSTDTHTITINDGTDPTGPDLLPGEDTNLILALEEAAIDASGSNPDSPAETMVSSSLSFTAGSDNLTSFTFADPSSITVSQATNTLNLTWSGSGNQLIGSIDGQTAIILQLEGSTILAGEQGTVKITATLTKAFPHEDTEVILNAIKVVASDTDGDQASADVRVIIADDSPTLEIADGPNSVTEGETLSGSWSLTPGADGVNEITITTPEGSSQTLQLAPGETADIEFDGKGTLTVKSDGTYTFTSDLNLDHTQAQSISFTLTAKDADGDTTSDTHTISITDGPDPQGGDLTTLDLDESALPGGTDETSTAEHQTTTLQFEAGSDNITGIQFGDTSSITVRNGAANPPTTITWVLSPDNQKLTGSINGVDVIELNLTSALIAAGTTGTAQISASLLSELPHATANTVDIIITGIQIKATDSDGSQSTGLLNITIKDDTPDVDIDPSQNLVLQGETISDQASIIGGADGLEKVFVSLDNGPAVELDMSNNTASKFYSKLGVLSVKADGSWEFTANTGVELGINDGVQFLITVQDGDGDTDTDSHFISIKQGADPIIGTQADDVLTGTETAELIKGLKGDDILSGGGGNDRLEGGKGKDTLEGGSGSDTFVLDTSNLNLSDLIVDYDDSGEDADKLDVTELIGSEDITQENVGNYFQYSGGVLSFDQDGAGTDHQMVEVATFANPPQQVELIVDEAQAPVVVAAV